MPLCFCVVLGCIHATTAEPDGCETPDGAQRLKRFLLKLIEKGADRWTKQKRDTQLRLPKKVRSDPI